MIGAFGNVVFVASSKTIRTFDEFNRKVAGRWAKHDVIGRKPQSQWVGADLDTLTFSMRFDAALGVKPRREADNLTLMANGGKVYPLTIGGKALGTGLWGIIALDITFEQVDHKGNVLVARANITIQEYPLEVRKR